MRSEAIPFNKNIGETPLEALGRLRKERPELAGEVLSYAGRLDPMAEGLLLVLVGEENKNREKYLGLDKEYEVEILFGFKTDTGDILGLVTEENLSSLEVKIKTEVEKILPEFVGEITQILPAYSSQPVGGKPLHQWAREGRLSEIERPSRVVKIYSIELLKERDISKKELLETIQNKISLVHGDFRQKEILEKWREVLEKSLFENHSFEIITIKVSCASGTYMRVLAEDIGKKCGTSALAYGIKRTRIGRLLDADY